MSEYIDTSESQAPHIPWMITAPENFRRVMQNQIVAHVTKEIDGITKLSKGQADGRFINDRPTTTLAMSNAHGFFYFVVGSSIVGLGAVAGP